MCFYSLTLMTILYILDHDFDNDFKHNSDEKLNINDLFMRFIFQPKEGLLLTF